MTDTNPPHMTPDGTFFDGHSMHRHDVDLAVSEEARLLRISSAALDTDYLWPLDDIREHRDHARKGAFVFGCAQEGAARLTVTAPEVLEQMRALCPNLSKSDVRPGAYRKITLWALGAVASVLLIVFVIIPGLAGQLAALVPVESEIALGNTVMSQLERFLGGDGAGNLACSSPEGDKALQKMAARLSDQIDSPYELRIRVLDHELINAFAVPGGNIVLFDGLVQDATSPEMVAGVLAHEFGHVIHRDSTRLMLQTAGSAGILGLLLGDFAGGAAILLVSEQLVTASYQQEAETDADTFAHEVLASAKLPAAPMGAFFLRVKDKYGEIEGPMSHLVSHPDLDGRAAAADAADTVGNGAFSPVLNAQEWSALRAICGNEAGSEDE